jgi:hypothetical protein
MFKFGKDKEPSKEELQVIQDKLESDFFDMHSVKVGMSCSACKDWDSNNGSSGVIKRILDENNVLIEFEKTNGVYHIDNLKRG